MTKVLCIYAGIDRRKLEEKVKAGESPDTVFFGFLHAAKHPGIETEYLQLSKDVYGWGGAFFRRFAFMRSLYVLTKFYGKFAAQDVLFLTSSAYFDLLFFRKLGFLRKQKWIILNLDLSLAFKKRATKPFSRRFLLSTIREAERIVCISKAQEKDLLDLGLPTSQVVFTPFGVDKNFYHPMTSSGEVVLTIGRDVGRDIPTFLEAVKRAGEPTVMICSPYNVAGLEDKIPPNLTVLFDQPYEVLKSYYQKAKLFVIATKPSEALVGSDCPGQTAVLDTLAYGMPIIATWSPWFEGYFENGRHLVIVPPGDPEALSAAIKKVSNDHALSAKLSVEGRKLIETTCNSEAMGQAIAKFIVEVV